MYKIFSKKGSLELSVNSIVIMVIAFVVLGLILVFSRNIFAQGRAQTEKAFAGIDLGQEASPDKPLVFDDITLKQGGESRFKVSFYNANPDTANKVSLVIASCEDPNSNTPIKTLSELPNMNSNSLTVNSGKTGEFRVTFSLSGRNKFKQGNTYICELHVANGAKNGDTITIPAGTKKCGDAKVSCAQSSFFLEVTS